jgi:radical SAM protein with 4Fe4S-binding SPASM domain
MIGRNFCLAPFTQITYTPLGSASPCPYLGGEAWKFGNKSISEIWESQEFESLRSAFHANEKNPTCTRCWREEDQGKQSARKLTLVNYRYRDNLLGLVDAGYKSGPQQINLRVGNLCNLRCRTCSSVSSVTYAIEGRHYEINNDLDTTVYTNYPNVFEFSNQQIDEIFAASSNLKRLEFYGGEPILDRPIMRLLQLLIDSGQSQNITLFYNTNGITRPTNKHIDLWKQFKNLEFNLSIDGIREQFTYIRHPGNWETALENMEYLRNKIPALCRIPASTFVICTVSIFNVFYLPEIIKEFDSLGLDWFLNIVTHPKYYDIKNLPEPVKEEVIKKLLTIKNQKEITPIINILKLPSESEPWQQFKFWTKEKDEYRGEAFKNVFPEFYNLIKTHDADI